MRASPLPVGVAGLLVLFACSDTEVRSGPATTAVADGSTTTAPTTTVPTTTTTVPTTTTLPATTVPEEPSPLPVLERGDSGPAVSTLQQRLRELRYWTGGVDGVFGRLTEQALYAFQKANAIPVDGRVGAQTRTALENPVALASRTTAGRVMEIDKSRQLLFAVMNGELQWVFNTSTGTERPYHHPGGYVALADTPPGRHTVYYQFDGWQDGRLGPMYRPKYFHRDGIAVHGYHSVPPWPASHGCVRVSLEAMDQIWTNRLMPLESAVLVYGDL